VNPGLLKITQRDGIHVVVLTGEHDLATRDDLLAAIHPLLASGAQVIVDLTRAEFIDSSIIGLLIECHLQAETEPDAAFAIVVPGAGMVRRVLNVTGLAAIMPLYSSVTAVLHKLRQDAERSRRTDAGPF
jgi:anti-anti-sigma factor